MNRGSDPLIGQIIAGKYEIISVLGGGGMGTVYRAKQAPINREVAIKIINVDLQGTEQFIKRFRREAEAIAALEHPHIIPVIDYGQQDEVTYLVMALKNGGSLGDLMHREQLSLQEITRIVGQIAQALDYAHLRGIIHRDLKPGNVLLDEERNTFLTDFGIARKVGETKLTAQGMVVGSPVYMAPEAWRGEEASAETDVYSLGVILFELLTRHPPYVDKAPARLMLKHISEPIPSVLAERPDLPPTIDMVISQALAKDRNQRFNKATALAAMLKSVALSPIETARQSPDGDETTILSRPTAMKPPTHVAQQPTPIQQPAPRHPAQAVHPPGAAPTRSAAPTPLASPHIANPLGELAPPEARRAVLSSNRLVLIGMAVVIFLLLVAILVLLVAR